MKLILVQFEVALWCKRKWGLSRGNILLRMLSSCMPPLPVSLACGAWEKRVRYTVLSNADPFVLAGLDTVKTFVEVKGLLAKLTENLFLSDVRPCFSTVSISTKKFFLLFYQITLSLFWVICSCTLW